MPPTPLVPLEIKLEPSSFAKGRQYYMKLGRYICPKCSKEFWMTTNRAANQFSCGCGVFRGTIKHGLMKHPLYKVWKSMRQRCQTETDAAFHNYGGRGISICEEWQEFRPFYDWAVANGWKPYPEFWIERIDNNGNYEPGNCRFARPYEQAHNRRTNVITKEGVIALRHLASTGLPIPHLAKEFGLKYKTVWEIVTYKRWKKI